MCRDLLKKVPQVGSLPAAVLPPKRRAASERGWMEPKKDLGLSANNVTATLDSYLVSRRH